MRHEVYEITQWMDWIKASVFALITLRRSSKGSSVHNIDAQIPDQMFLNFQINHFPILRNTMQAQNQHKMNVHDGLAVWHTKKALSED